MDPYGTVRNRIDPYGTVRNPMKLRSWPGMLLAAVFCRRVFGWRLRLSLTGSDLSLKRHWDDDTVFKNQARTAPKLKSRYINDAARSIA